MSNFCLQIGSIVNQLRLLIQTYLYQYKHSQLCQIKIIDVVEHRRLKHEQEKQLKQSRNHSNYSPPYYECIRHQGLRVGSYILKCSNVNHKFYRETLNWDFLCCFFITQFIKVERHFCIAIPPIVCSKPCGVLVRHLHPTCNVSVLHHLDL